mgnify:CR=1 FL=1
MKTIELFIVLLASLMGGLLGYAVAQFMLGASS